MKKILGVILILVGAGIVQSELFSFFTSLEATIKTLIGLIVIIFGVIALMIETPTKKPEKPLFDEADIYK